MHGLRADVFACRRGRVPTAAAAIIGLAVSCLPVASAADESDDLSEDILGYQHQIESETTGDPVREKLKRQIGDLMKRAKDYAARKNYPEAEKALAEAAALVPPDDKVMKSRVRLALAALKIEELELDSATAMLNEIEADPALGPKERERLGALRARIQKRLAHIQKERESAARAEIRRQFDAIEALPQDQAVAQGQALYNSHPGDARVANFYARLLARDRRWAEAEAVYLGIVGDASTNDLSLAENTQAVLGLVDLYQRKNRLASAGEWLGQLSTSYQYRGEPPPSRAADLQARQSRALQPDQYSLTLSASAGYSSNVNTPLDLIDELATLPSRNASSAFAATGLRMRYDHVVDGNGDKLRLLASVDEKAYFDVSNVDRTTLDVAGGYVYEVPDSTREFQFLVGHATRMIDYSSYRNTIYGSVTLSEDVTSTFGYSGELRFESNDDDIVERDGVAYEGDITLRQDMSAFDTLRGGIDIRYEDAKVDFESRTSVAAAISYKHEFESASLPGLYAVLAYNPSYTKYMGELPSGLDAGTTRRDFTNKLEISIGREDPSGWIFEMDGRYIDRNSNVTDKDSSTVEVMLTVARRFWSPL